MQPRMHMDEGTPYQPRIACYICRATLASSRIAVPYQYHQVAMINNPLASSEVGIVRTIMRGKLMKVLSSIQQTMIFLKGVVSGKYLFIFSARNHHFYRNT